MEDHKQWSIWLYRCFHLQHMDDHLNVEIHNHFQSILTLIVVVFLLMTMPTCVHWDKCLFFCCQDNQKRTLLLLDSNRDGILCLHSHTFQPNVEDYSLLFQMKSYHTLRHAGRLKAKTNFQQNCKKSNVDNSSVTRRRNSNLFLQLWFQCYELE